MSPHWPHFTQPSEMRNWSGTTRYRVVQAGQRVSRLMKRCVRRACDRTCQFDAVINIQPSSVSATRKAQ